MVGSTWTQHGPGIWSISLLPKTRAEIETALKKWCTPEQWARLQDLRKDIAAFCAGRDTPPIPSPP